MGANHPYETIDETKEVLINKGYHLTHEENIKKIREATTTVDTVKQCTSKYSIEMSQGHAIKDPEVRKSDLTNSGNLVEISEHRVERGDRNLENHLQNAP